MKIHQEWSRFHSDVDDVIPLAVKSDSSLVLLENQTNHGNPSCDISDPDTCSGGHSVPKQDEETETVCQITRMDESDDGDDDEEVSPQISLNAYTNEELGQKQRDDPELCKIFKWIEQDFPKHREEMFAESPGLRHFWLMRENLLLSNNCLFYRWEFPEETRKLFIVPDAMKGEVMEIAHCSPLSGHPGIKRTIQRLRQSFYWYNMTDYVTTFVGACEKCALSKKANKVNKSLMQQYCAGSPMDRIQLDILGPFPISKQGNKYILVLVDQFSKWTECYPLPDQTAESIASVLVKDFIAHFGVPLELHTPRAEF